MLQKLNINGHKITIYKKHRTDDGFLLFVSSSLTDQLVVMSIDRVFGEYKILKLSEEYNEARDYFMRLKKMSEVSSYVGE